MFVDFEEPTKRSRFQVTRSRDEVEVPINLSNDTEPDGNFSDNAAHINGNFQDGLFSSSSNNSVTPTTVTPSYFMSLNDYYNTTNGQDLAEKSHQATASSGTSYYNTIYKYNKMKSTLDDSLDHHYFPLIRNHLSPNSNNVHISFYTDRVQVYNFLQRPTGFLAIFYHIFVSIFVISCLILTIVSTSKEYRYLRPLLSTLDYLIIGFFVVEFIVRLWASECVSFYRGWKGKIRFFKNPIRIIDLIVIVISLGAVIFNAQGDLLVTSLRGVRFIQIFQMVRLDFKFRPWRMMASVVYSQRIHLAIVFYMGFLALIFISFIIYFVEKDINPQFDSLASSMWWAMITLTTIGYGDSTPSTSTGKVLCCICSVVGVSIFALPAGILGTGLALKVQEQRRQLKMSKRKQPAARVIQSAWRYYQSLNVIRRISCDNVAFPSYSLAIYSRFKKTKPTFLSQNGNLSRREMHAVHFIIATKLAIARQDFIDAFKPYDIKDVLEQYAAGHADMLAKVKLMDHRLEKIQANRAHNDFRIHVAASLSRLESKIDKFQTHVERLFEAQIESQRQIRFLTQIIATGSHKNFINKRDQHSVSIESYFKSCPHFDKLLATSGNNCCSLLFDNKSHHRRPSF